MKILLVTQYYWPENSRVTDIAESLSKKGNQVTALTGLPNYPQGYIYEGYKKGENRIQNHNGVDIIRAKLIERRKDVFHRFLNYFSFPYYGKKIARKLPNDFDVVLAMEESPIILVLPALEYARKNNKKVLMYEMDLWPESLLAGGIKPSSLIYKYFKKQSIKIYSQCDKILVCTKEHSDYIKELTNKSNLDISYLTQYAETVFENNEYKQIEDEHIDLMFAGNIGKGQSVKTILLAANELKDDTKYLFHIVGYGSEYDNCVELSKKLNLNNLIFYGRIPMDEMPELYNKADIMLVTLEDKSYANKTIPGKVHTYMASGKPILSVCNGSCSNFVNENNIGYTVKAEDYISLANAIKTLDEKDMIKKGINSRKTYFEKYSKNIFISTLQQSLEDLIK